MKKTLLTLIIAAAGILASAQIRPEPKKDGGIFAGMDPATRIQLMKQFDKDGDGRLNEQERRRAKRSKTNLPTLNELKKNHAKDVKKFDVDGDGN
ncbi:MAG: EF-hand domain-containing protein [Bacilli bacterium]